MPVWLTAASENALNVSARGTLKVNLKLDSHRSKNPSGHTAGKVSTYLRVVKFIVAIRGSR